MKKNHCEYENDIIIIDLLFTRALYIAAHLKSENFTVFICKLNMKFLHPHRWLKNHRENVNVVVVVIIISCIPGALAHF